MFVRGLCALRRWRVLLQLGERRLGAGQVAGLQRLTQRLKIRGHRVRAARGAGTGLRTCCRSVFGQRREGALRPRQVPGLQSPRELLESALHLLVIVLRVPDRTGGGRNGRDVHGHLAWQIFRGGGDPTNEVSARTVQNFSRGKWGAKGAGWTGKVLASVAFGCPAAVRFVPRDEIGRAHV